ncbi:MAG: GTPase HflX [Phycisphaerales bacterium]|nr:GTPase HflX [Phycisphaerales bacterium]
MPAPSERTNIKVQSERAILAAVRLPESVYDQANPFGELAALAEQAGAIVVGEMEQRRQKPEAATFIGSGKLEELRDMCDALDASLIVFDHDLSPRQIRNIEEIVSAIPPEDDADDNHKTSARKKEKPKRRAVKVIDRSELILDIFASRATTHEAKLQVELAQMEYTYPRLRAMWDHLERIVGGGPVGIGSRGPGEQQLEIDRRLAQAKKLDLKRELDAIYQRKRRMVRDRKKDHFTVGIVGYTNAGKSTLFNALTAGGAYADDRVFATLVTRTREWDLGGGIIVMLSDTVGFVRDLPHHLIASFRATLEEATHADLVLIVLDVSDPAAELQYNTVVETLDELESEVRDIEEREGNLPESHAWGDSEGWRPAPRILLLNKADRLADNRDLLVWQRKHPGALAISAIQPPPDGLGHEQLRRIVLAAAQSGVVEIDVTVPHADGKAIQRLENRGHVLERTYTDDGLAVKMRVRLGRRQLDQLRSGSPGLAITERAQM